MRETEKEGDKLQVRQLERDRHVEKIIKRNTE